MEAIIMFLQVAVPDLTVLVMPTVTVTGSGLAAYVGVKVALAEIKIKLENHEKRLDRLEDKYFRE